MEVPLQHRWVRYDAQIVVKTPKAASTFRLLNPRRLAVTQLAPENFFPPGALNCDFVFQVPDQPTEVYVELKGGDLHHAMKQLGNTITLLRSSFKPEQRVCFVVMTRAPRLDLQTQNLLKAFRKNYKCKVEHKGHPFEYSL